METACKKGMTATLASRDGGRESSDRSDCASVASSKVGSNKIHNKPMSPRVTDLDDRMSVASGYSTPSTGKSSELPRGGFPGAALKAVSHKAVPLHSWDYRKPIAPFMGDSLPGDTVLPNVADEGGEQAMRRILREELALCFEKSALRRALRAELQDVLGQAQISAPPGRFLRARGGVSSQQRSSSPSTARAPVQAENPFEGEEKQLLPHFSDVEEPSPSLARSDSLPASTAMEEDPDSKRRAATPATGAMLQMEGGRFSDEDDAFNGLDGLADNLRFSDTENAHSKKDFKSYMQGYGTMSKREVMSIVRFHQWLLTLEEPVREGRMADIVQSNSFGAFFMGVILVHGAFSFYTTNVRIHTLEEPPLFLRAVDLAFLLAYSIEISMRGYVHRGYFFVNNDWRWNNFDAILVVIAWWEELMHLATVDVNFDTKFMRYLRVLKMARVLRMFKVFHMFAELRQLCEALSESSTSLAYCMVAVVFILYIFAVLFVQGTAEYLIEEGMDSEESMILVSHFGSVQRAMLTLYVTAFSGDDWGTYYEALIAIGPIHSMIYLFFQCFSNVALMNIITAVFVEHTLAMAKPDYEDLAFENHAKALQEQTVMKRLCAELDTDHSGSISAEEFRVYMANPDSALRKYLEANRLEMRDVELFFHMLLSYNEDLEVKHGVEISAFVRGCLKMRGDVTSLDMQLCIWQGQLIHKKQNKQLESIEKRLSALLNDPTTEGFSI